MYTPTEIVVNEVFKFRLKPHQLSSVQSQVWVDNQCVNDDFFWWIGFPEWRTFLSQSGDQEDCHSRSRWGDLVLKTKFLSHDPQGDISISLMLIGKVELGHFRPEPNLIELLLFLG